MLRRTGLIALGWLLLWCTNVEADWRCRCGTVVHVDYPTDCPTCGRRLPNADPPRDDRVQDGTGLKLGVAVYEVNRRVIVERVLPNTPASGKLFQNDRIVKGAFRDVQDGLVYRVNIYSPGDIARLKSMAGPGTKVALEVSRPTSGVRSFFVTFATDGVVTTRTETYSATVSANTGVQSDSTASRQVTETRIVEDSSGEAAQWLRSERDAPREGTSRQSDSALDPVRTEGSGNSQGESAADLLNPR